MRDKRFVLVTVLMPLFNFYSVPINDFPGYTSYFLSVRGIDLPYWPWQNSKVKVAKNAKTAKYVISNKGVVLEA